MGVEVLGVVYKVVYKSPPLVFAYLNIFSYEIKILYISKL